MFTTENFSLHELVPKDVHDKYGNSAWRFLNVPLLKLIDHLQQVFGTATINNWKWGGGRNYSGFRPPDCEVGAGMSAHKRGCAFDIIFKHISAEDVRDYIRRNASYLCTLIGVGCIVIESTINGEPISWLHVAVENMEGPLVELHL